ncbi:MAG TPA: lactate racemase domain-containing protein, partial [Candidatus Limnocylindrales bacterium]
MNRTVRLAYGLQGLDIDVPADRSTVVAPRHRPSARDPLEELRRAIRNPVGGSPLRQLVKRGHRVAISVCDITRPQPRELMLTAILEALDGIVPPQNVV